MEKTYSVTAQAFEHALQIINANYPGLPDEQKQKRAVELAAKICKREKH